MPVWTCYALLGVIGVLMLANPIVVHWAKHDTNGVVALMLLLATALSLQWIASPRRPW